MIRIIIGLISLFCIIAYASPPSTPPVAAAASMRPYELTTTTSGPLVITAKQNIVISGIRVSNPDGNCIQVNGSSNITIKNSQIGPCKGNGIEINSSQSVVIEQNNIINTRMNISLYDAKDILIQANYIDTGKNGINVNRSSGVKILLNYATKFIGGYPYGHFIQFDNVTGSGNEIKCNTGDAYPMPDPLLPPPTERVEDIINLWQSHGTAQSPIMVAYNRVRGGSSYTGSGILLGDGAGSYQTAYKNVIVNPWNVSIAVAGGNNMVVDSNRMYSNLPWQVSGSGTYIHNFYPQYATCYNITFARNLLKWPTGGPYTDQFWNPNTCTNISGLETNNLNATYLTESIFTEPITECKALAQSKGYSLTGWE